MTGEKAPQPGGREPAPDPLALVQAFVNTHYDLTVAGGGERLVDAGALRSWLAGQALLGERARLGPDALGRALAVREGLRALAHANNGRRLDAEAVAAMQAAADGARVAVRIEPEGPQFGPGPDAGLDGALGALLTVVARAMLADDWRRLKACPGAAAAGCSTTTRATRARAGAR